jgi:hypothetical protein
MVLSTINMRFDEMKPGLRQKIASITLSSPWAAWTKTMVALTVWLMTTDFFHESRGVL